MRNLTLLFLLSITSCNSLTSTQQSQDSNNERQKFIDVVTSCVGGTKKNDSYKVIAEYDKKIQLGFSMSEARSYALKGLLASFNPEDRIEAYDKYVNCFKN